MQSFPDMRYSKVFPKTRREAPKDAVAANHKYLVRAGFIDQLMAGSWTLLPLGWRVVRKIMDIIREEMNAVGAQEMLMPLLHPKEIWNQTGRWEKAGNIMYKLQDERGREYALSFTHEEIVMDLIRKHIRSYQDLPLAIYHFSTKFRNEPRSKSGILRAREFIMKDLYSAHTSEEDMLGYYEKVKKAYSKIFSRLGFDFVVTEASGGVFTQRHTHEFQVLADVGEDEIIYCPGGDFAENAEIAKVKEGKQCELGHGPLKKARSIEVGNIFPLGKWYAEKMGVTFTAKDGSKKPVWLASYGIGVTRVLGALVEVSHDERGIIWFPQVAPYDVHLTSVTGDTKQVTRRADKVYETLQKAGIDVLYDDRDLAAGEKFADADLIGIPVRLVVSKETGDEVEWKPRNSEKTQLLSVEELVKRLQKATA